MKQENEILGIRYFLIVRFIYTSVSDNRNSSKLTLSGKLFGYL